MTAITDAYNAAFSTYSALGLTQTVTLPTSGDVTASVKELRFPEKLLDSDVDEIQIRFIKDLVTLSEVEPGKKIKLNGETWTIETREAANTTFIVVYAYNRQKGHFRRS